MLINANALSIPLAAKSVHTVVTSPPYYGTTAVLWYNECMNNNNGRFKKGEHRSPSTEFKKGDVWTVTTKPYKGAHYATFNPELIKPCILAGAPEGGIVFDPFVGSGTTVATAIQLGRKGIGIDLSFKYLQENAKVRVESAELPLLDFIEQ